MPGGLGTGYFVLYGSVYLIEVSNSFLKGLFLSEFVFFGRGCMTSQCVRTFFCVRTHESEICNGCDSK
jgi:hypothetical protein